MPIGSAAWFAPTCASWIFLSRGSTGRSSCCCNLSYQDIIQFRLITGNPVVYPLINQCLSRSRPRRQFKIQEGPHGKSHGETTLLFVQPQVVSYLPIHADQDFAFVRTCICLMKTLLSVLKQMFYLTMCMKHASGTLQVHGL